MKKTFLLLSFLILNACKPAVMEYVISRSRTVIDIDDAKFVVEENSVVDSQKIRIEKKSALKIINTEGYRIVGPAYSIGPESLVFAKPVLFACPTNKNSLKLAVKIANGFVPLAESRVAGESLQAKIRHGGEYFLVETPEKYGILNPVKTDQGLLIVSDLYVGKYLDNFKKVLKKEGYKYPVWTFIYSGDRSIEENANLLAEEMKKFHAEYGKFRLDVVSFGVGGLVLLRYGSDSLLYQKDISSAVICIGTPFAGSDFALSVNVNKSRSPYRFFYQDGMAENVVDIIPGSILLNWIKENNTLFDNYGPESDENKNFASITGKKIFSGTFSEEEDGDGLTSLSSAMLSPVEPDPFPYDHFELFDKIGPQEVAGRFVMLYRDFNWSTLFNRVFKGQDPFSRITEIWEKDTRLNFRKNIDFDALLEWYDNILKSTPLNAILITNGDIDTYTGWYLQQQGVRNDVMIVNIGLLNRIPYVRYLQKNGLPLDMNTQQIDSLKPYHDEKTNKTAFVSDQIINLLIKQQTRPLVFSTTVSPMQLENYSVPLKLNGLIYKIDTGEVKGLSWMHAIDVDNTKDLFSSKFRYDKLFSVPFDSLSPIIRALVTNYRVSLYRLQNALVREKKYDEALRVIGFAKKFNEITISEGGMYLYFFEANILQMMDQKDKADSVLEEGMRLPIGFFITQIDSSNVASAYKNAALLYHKMGKKEKSIQILAKAIEFTPMDKGILDLIKKYQEE